MDHLDLSIVVDFEGTNCKYDESIVDGDVDYVHWDCEGTLLGVNKLVFFPSHLMCIMYMKSSFSYS